MRIFKVPWFGRFAKKQKISDEELVAIVKDLEKGIFDVDLGGGVYKQRIARPGKGRSTGYRVILFFKSGASAFFVYGFAKSDRANITQSDLRDFRDFYKDQFVLTDDQLNVLVKIGELEEILYEELTNEQKISK
jgi:hypothetical protein